MNESINQYQSISIHRTMTSNRTGRTPPAGLTDIQKSDLSSIWDAHTVGIVDQNNRNQHQSSSSSSSPSPSSSLPLDIQSFNYIASLTAFFVHVVNDHADNRIEYFTRKNDHSCRHNGDDGDGDGDGDSGDENNNDNNNDNHNDNCNENEEEERKCKFPSAIDTIKSFFPKLFSDGFIQHQCDLGRNGSNSNNNGNGNRNGIDRQQQKQKLKAFITTPHIPSKFNNSNGRRRHILTVDHATFLKELDIFNHGLGSYGSLLYHRAQYGHSVINSAIALFLITLLRRSSSSTSLLMQPSNNSTMTAMNNRNNHNNNHHYYSNIINTIVIHTRFHNVYPTIQIQHVKTSNAYKFITLKGRIIKVHPKRLRLFSADMLCLKCGKQFEHLFYDGIYELPTRCRAAQQDTTTSNNNSNNNSNKACRGQKFELVRRTAKYIDYQKLKIQEEDQVLNNAASTSSGTDLSSISSMMPNNNNTSSNHHNSRRATNSSSPTGGAAAGRAPRSIDLEVTHDLVDSCHAGDCVKVVGIIHGMNTAVASGRGGRKAANETSTYTLYMKANSIVNTTADLHVSSRNISSSSMRGRGLVFTKEQLEKITKVAHADHLYGPLSVRMAFPFDLLVRSLCPSIIGHDCVKAGILLGLLGGTPSSGGLEDTKSGLTIRSNIHCLIVGDPGMGKSCLLLASQQVAARSVYVGGNTSSTTGLTVSLSKEAGGEVGIEAGALVLADQGVCCIDEFDKMARSNQDGLLEAMEQQRISIAKAGAIASLPSRCAVIAAANPKQGKYNLNKTVAENLNIAPPLLSRFDLVFILRDNADIDHDKLVSGNIMNMYRQQDNHNDDRSRSARKRQKTMESALSKQFDIKQRLPWVAQTQNPLPAELLKDYISYAREYCKPKLTQEAAAVLKNYFMTLRYPENGQCRNDSVPITTRQLEALIRLSQARAKSCLREFVLKEDAEDVVELMRESVNQVHMDSDGRLDKTRGGVVGKSKRKQKKAFIDMLRQMPQDYFSKNDFYRVAAQLALPLNDFWTLVDELRYSDQPELRKGPDGNYYLL